MLDKAQIINRYKSVIFDFDGVILDSNNVKKNAIGESVEGVLNKDETVEFVNYFTRFNGVPREEKIARHVPENEYENVLNRYEAIINKKLRDATMIPGVQSFIQELSNNDKDMIVLSGGTESEVKELLDNRGLVDYFSGVFGGPKNKEENLVKVNLQGPVIYFGDSEVDYNVANKHKFDFVFVYGATNIENWEEKTSPWNIVGAIKDFNNEVINDKSRD